jgi:hypothetical protein
MFSASRFGNPWPQWLNPNLIIRNKSFRHDLLTFR